MKKEKRKESNIVLLKIASEVCKWGALVSLYLTGIMFIADQIILIILDRTTEKYFDLLLYLDKVALSIQGFFTFTTIAISIEGVLSFIIYKRKSEQYYKKYFFIGTIIIWGITIVISCWAIKYIMNNPSNWRIRI